MTTKVVSMNGGVDTGSQTPKMFGQPEASDGDLQRNLPTQFFSKRPLRFAVKFWFALALIAIGYIAIIASVSWIVTAIAMLVLGFMYAHLVELQHECLHGHAFKSRRLNHIYGFFCGLFMLSSYSYYQYEHLRHHATLGQPDNREFFSYRLRHLDSLRGFLLATFHLGRYVDVLHDMARSLAGNPIPGVERERNRKQISKEYRLFVSMIAGVAAFTALTGNLLFVFAWLVPLLTISEPTHFLIELPEHFGLNTQNDPNVLANTRTIDTSRFAQWFTNFNNLHTAHHYHQGVPMANVARLNELVRERYEAIEPSYRSFYIKVIRGKIRYIEPSAEVV
ncbi:MAG: fatty acid desaturase family protein [Solirubrobacteraceae bacterium]